MYFTRLPDHKEPGFDEQLHFSKFKKHNIVFNATSRKVFCERHVGCLSLKTVLSGEEWYGIGSHQLAVRPGQFLFMNDDQDYSCRIDTPLDTRSFSIFFKKEFAFSVFRDVLFGEDSLLDNPFETGAKELEFFQTLYDTGPRLQEKLLGLIAALEAFGYNKDMVDEHLVFLLHDLILAHKFELRRANKVHAVKANTRTEIYKRLCIAKDFLHSTFMEKPDLSLISHTACLSTPQLVRQFKAAFQTTPHQYLTRIRLAHAAELLKNSNEPVQEITGACGFDDTSAFCRAFKTAYGVPPLYFRARK